MQKMFITGFVGRDPEEKFTSTGKKVTSFSIGVNIKKSGEKITLWYRIDCWGETCASILPYLKKGSCLTVVGDLNPPTTYQNKKGDISLDLSLVANSICFYPSFKPQEEKKAEEDKLAEFDYGEKL